MNNDDDMRRGNARDTGSGRSRDSDRDARRSEMQAALDRLERAVEGLASTARVELSQRATRFIDETTARLEDELASRRGRDRSRRDARRQARREARAIRYARTPRGVGPYKDRRRRKISGVCAGLATYFGMDTWLVRGIAISGALFFPGLVIPAYIITAFVLDDMPRDDAGEPVIGVAQVQAAERRDRSRNEGQVPAQRNFRDTQALMSQAELRLRRMEAHVTSGRYELQKELGRLETGGHTGATV
ncbi:MAG: PspC domain-containing protein [Pseudomonadales bacterium]|nr:PspC domain-containing protein [Pseudomonadales bacterium]